MNMERSGENIMPSPCPIFQSTHTYRRTPMLDGTRNGRDFKLCIGPIRLFVHLPTNAAGSITAMNRRSTLLDRY